MVFAFPLLRISIVMQNVLPKWVIKWQNYGFSPKQPKNLSFFFEKSRINTKLTVRMGYYRKHETTE